MSRIGHRQPQLTPSVDLSRTEAPAQARGSAPVTTPPLPQLVGAQKKSEPKASAVVPQASLLATKTKLSEVSERLQGSSDPVLRAAGEAAKAVQGMLLVPRPVRIDLADKPNRPSSMEGTIRREIKGAIGQETLKVTFVPFDKSLGSFPIPPEAAEGITSHAKVSLRQTRQPDGTSTYAIHPDPDSIATHFIADVVEENGQTFAIGRGLLTPHQRIPLKDAETLVGQAIVARVSDGPSGPRATVERPLGDAKGPEAKFIQIAIESGAEIGFSPGVMAEVKELQRNPRITGTDLTHLPFITIDNDDSRDLDQAMCIQKRPGGGYTVNYAIADVSHFIQPGSRLDKTAARRSSTAYPPGMSLPMFPREISEGFVSLLPDGPRRAFVVSVDLDASMKIEGEPKFQRGVIQNHGKLAYNGVQKFFDDGAKSTTDNAGYVEGLRLLKTVGVGLVENSKKRGVVPSPDLESRVSVKDGKVSLQRRGRNEVEKWNEQISLLVNSVVGRKIQSAGVQSLHRTHREPEPSRLAAFDAQAAALGMPRKPGEKMNEYAERLDPSDPKTLAIQRMLTRIHPAAKYSQEAVGHAALKLDAYDHFTAPLRRYTDIVVHRVLAALVEGTPVPYQGREASRLDSVINRTSFAKSRDGAISDKTLAFATEQALSERLGQPLSGVIVDTDPRGFVVALSDPSFDVRVSTSSLNRASGNGNHVLGDSGVELSGPTGTFRRGTEIQVVARKGEDGRIEVVPSTVAGQ
ncbi:MAG: RNB domain-containing ribonuclease [Deltaproteobacteria bacterium]|nr:RNB domain-containing ribonuclease [Deltaproteobacteria bacterium]